MNHIHRIHDETSSFEIVCNHGDSGVILGNSFLGTFSEGDSSNADIIFLDADELVPVLMNESFFGGYGTVTVCFKYNR